MPTVPTVRTAESLRDDFFFIMHTMKDCRARTFKFRINTRLSLEQIFFWKLGPGTFLLLLFLVFPLTSAIPLPHLSFSSTATRLFEKHSHEQLEGDDRMMDRHKETLTQGCCLVLELSWERVVGGKAVM